MKSLIFKVSAVFVTVISVTLMGAALSVYFVHPDASAEINTPAMLNYTFERTTGETESWKVNRRFSVDPANPKERGSVGTFNSVYQAIAKAHEDLASQKGRKKNDLSAAKEIVDLQLKQFEASQLQDIQAIKDRAAMLKVASEQWQTLVQSKSDEAQAISVKTLEVREETEARRTDVERLRHELQEARTDLFRLNEILRHDTDHLLRLQLENQAMELRRQQLLQSTGN